MHRDGGLGAPTSEPQAKLENPEALDLNSGSRALWVQSVGRPTGDILTPHIRIQRPCALNQIWASLVLFLRGLLEIYPTPYAKPFNKACNLEAPCHTSDAQEGLEGQGVRIIVCSGNPSAWTQSMDSKRRHFAKQASKQAGNGKQASRQASTQAGKQASKQTNKQASKQARRTNMSVLLQTNNLFDLGGHLSD